MNENVMNAVDILCRENRGWYIVYRGTDSYFDPKIGWYNSSEPIYVDSPNEIVKAFFESKIGRAKIWDADKQVMITRERFFTECLNQEKVMETAKPYLPHVIANDGTLTIFTMEEQLVFAPDNPNLAEAKEALKAGDVEKLKELATPAKAIDTYLNRHEENVALGEKGCVIRDGMVWFDGEVMHNALTDKILELRAEGLPFDNMMNFLTLLMQNPSKRSTEQLWNFVSQRGLAIDSDGWVIAFKRVLDDFYDIHSHTVLYSIGSTVSMKRNKIDEDSRKLCSVGLHCGNLHYIKGFGSGGHILIVKFNPADVVSVPDCSHENNKIRVCSMLVVGEYNGKLPSDTYAKATEYVQTDEDDYYDEYEDEDDED